MDNLTNSPVPLDVALFFVQKLPLSYQKAIFDWLSTNQNLQSTKATQLSQEKRIPLKFGAGKHLITYVADDFDEPLDEFEEYM